MVIQYLRTRIHLNWFRCLNKFLSLSFGDRTYSYVLKQSDMRYTYILIRSKYVLYNSTIYIRTLWQYLLCRNCTSFYESDKIIRLSAFRLWVDGNVGIYKVEWVNQKLYSVQIWNHRPVHTTLQFFAKLVGAFLRGTLSIFWGQKSTFAPKICKRMLTKGSVSTLNFLGAYFWQACYFQRLPSWKSWKLLSPQTTMHSHSLSNICQPWPSTPWTLCCLCCQATAWLFPPPTTKLPSVYSRVSWRPGLILFLPASGWIYSQIVLK